MESILIDRSIADDTFGAKKLVKNNNFTGQTNSVDVDKHMYVLPSLSCASPYS